MTNQDYIALARERYSSVEIQIDDDARVCRGDDKGAFVQAWVWVRFDDEGELK